MEYLDHLIDTFRAAHPEMDADLLREFAQHVHRVVRDDIRQEMRAENVRIRIAMQLNGSSFSAEGPRLVVEDMLERWDARAVRQAKNLPPSGFNRMALISGR